MQPGVKIVQLHFHKTPFQELFQKLPVNYSNQNIYQQYTPTKSFPHYNWTCLDSFEGKQCQVILPLKTEYFRVMVELIAFQDGSCAHQNGQVIPFCVLEPRMEVKEDPTEP